MIHLDGQSREATYRIEVKRGEDGYPPRIIGEKLLCEGFERPIFEAKVAENWESIKSSVINVSFDEKNFEYTWDSGPPELKNSLHNLYGLPNIKPVLSQIKDLHLSDRSFQNRGIEHSRTRQVAIAVLETLSEMRFLDLNPESMRVPSIPGQPLGDRGENLSSALQAICQDSKRKQSLLQWIQELTPMDARDFEFPADFTGRILLRLVEENGQKISAYSASDGTLRFLGAIALLLEPTPTPAEAATTKCSFFEELDNGIHPTRLQLLLELLERSTSAQANQIIATTHSPQLLRFLSPQSLEYVSLAYRLPGQSDAKIKRILDIPDARRVLQKQDIAHLYESGWLEDVVDFLEDEVAIA